MCEHAYFDKGHRSCGANVPCYAQGAYFPGDEPSIVCHLSGETCDDATCPEKEAAMQKTLFYCPECEQDNTRRYLAYDDSSKTFVCPQCQTRYSAKALRDLYQDDFNAYTEDAAWVRDSMIGGLISFVKSCKEAA